MENSDVAANVQCTDTSVEAVNFQADSFSIYGISLLTENTEDGIFRDGTATVKLEAGSVVTVTGDWNYFPNGSKVEISSLEIPSPQTFRP